jgi:hypothetical protein
LVVRCGCAQPRNDADDYHQTSQNDPHAVHNNRSLPLWPPFTGWAGRVTERARIGRCLSPM